jgi:hypothetical protein
MGRPTLLEARPGNVLEAFLGGVLVVEFTVIFLLLAFLLWLLLRPWLESSEEVFEPLWQPQKANCKEAKTPPVLQETASLDSLASKNRCTPFGTAIPALKHQTR